MVTSLGLRHAALETAPTLAFDLAAGILLE
jgi:hypothetical protein